MDFKETMKHRRSIYAIGSDSPISDDAIVDIVRHAVMHAPSPFNCQCARVVVLLGERHAQFWSIVMEALRARVAPDKFGPTQTKIEGFAAGHGTLLYYNDKPTIEKLQQQFPSYAESFPTWGEHANAIVQFACWCMLEEQGLGANLQHYAPLVDDEVKAAFGLPREWTFIAQMPFGSVVAPAGDKTFLPIDERVFVQK